MVGFWAGEDLSPNLIELARLQAQARGGYLDLTSSNPTHQGLLFPPSILRSAAAEYWDTRQYDPDPRGSARARDAIVNYYGNRKPPLSLTREQITITASTSEAYSLLFALTTEPGDNILAPQVTYPLFDFLAALHHVELRPYRMREDEHWAIDEESLIYQRDSRTRAVLIVSPHNPTGKVISEPIAGLRTLGLPVICDEVFAPFTYAINDTPPLAALYPELPIFLLNGISKMFALPDLKLGWIVCSALAQATWGDRLELLNDTFLGANSLTQSMLPALFEYGGGFVDEMCAYIRRNLDSALVQLRASSRLRVEAPDGGYYLFPEVLDEDDEQALILRLLERGLYLHPGYFYGYKRGVHLMLSALTTSAVLEEGIARLLTVLDEFG